MANQKANNVLRLCSKDSEEATVWGRFTKGQGWR